MTGHGAKFGRKKEEAIGALLLHRNTEEAARAVGIAPKTLLRWLQIPEFQAAFRAAKWAVYSQAIGRLHQNVQCGRFDFGESYGGPEHPGRREGSSCG